MEDTHVADALEHVDDPLEPDVSHLVTEDGEPVDSVFSERQMRLLAGSLHASWKPGRDFLALANVGIFSRPDRPAVVPDVMLSLDVTFPEDICEKGNRSYLIWRYGKPPDLVVEVVSNRHGGELEKADTYARIAVGWYVIYDPERHLGQRPLRAYELHGRRYVELLDCSWLEQLGLGLTLWEGTFEGLPGTWLRWCDRDRNLLLTGEEQAAVERARAEEERARAEEASARAEEERARAERMLARLREMGFEGEP